MQLTNIFLFYSIFCNIFERVIMQFIDKTYVSGFMRSIFTPIYGIAMIIILYVNKKIKIKNKIPKILIEFFLYAIIMSIIELSGGLLIEKVFNKVFWNYDKYKYNIGIYISLETALFWGFLSVIILYLFHPLYKKIEKHIPKYITVIIGTFFIINLFYSLIVK